jgi:hypothetical protein
VFAVRYLPWMGRFGWDQKPKYTWICDVKSSVCFEELHHRFPTEPAHCFHAVRGIRFSEKPDYADFRLMFRELFMRECHVCNCRHDWERLGGPAPTAPLREKPVVSAGPDSLAQEEIFGPAHCRSRHSR